MASLAEMPIPTATALAAATARTIVNTTAGEANPTAPPIAAATVGVARTTATRVETNSSSPKAGTLAGTVVRRGSGFIASNRREATLELR